MTAEKDFTVVIPARFASMRLPGKALADIAGRPMIAWVHEQARASGAREVIVATDDGRIADVCRDLGANVVLTSPDHASGSDRIAEVAERLAWDDATIVVNVQGDEPLVPPALIDQVARKLGQHPDADIATLMTTFADAQEFRDVNSAKVIVDGRGYALYFSRAAIPHTRDGAVPEEARRHIGLYAYRVGSLKALARLPVCWPERHERLEQLRALWNGMRIVVADAVTVPARGVDCQEDLDAVRKLVEAGRARAAR